MSCYSYLQERSLDTIGCTFKIIHGITGEYIICGNNKDAQYFVSHL